VSQSGAGILILKCKIVHLIICIHTCIITNNLSHTICGITANAKLALYKCRQFTFVKMYRWTEPALNRLSRHFPCAAEKIQDLQVNRLKLEIRSQLYILSRTQGDQIGRFFAIWAWTCKLWTGNVFENFTSRRKFWKVSRVEQIFGLKNGKHTFRWKKWVGLHFGWFFIKHLVPLTKERTYFYSSLNDLFVHKCFQAWILRILMKTGCIQIWDLFIDVGTRILFYAIWRNSRCLQKIYAHYIVPKRWPTRHAALSESPYTCTYLNDIFWFEKPRSSIPEATRAYWHGIVLKRIRNATSYAHHFFTEFDQNNT
jgi:hypothetical protein